MNIIFLFLLTILTICAYVLTGKDILSPWVILCSIFLGVLILVLLNSSKWDVVFYEYPVILILLSLIMWGVGSGVGILGTCRVTQEENPRFLDRLKGYYPALFICIVSLICTIIYIFKELQRVDLNGGITAAIRQLYEKAVQNQGGSFIQNQLFEIIVVLAYLSIYRIFVKAFLLKKTDPIGYPILMFPILNFMVATIIRTDRNVYLRACIYTAVLWIFFFRQKTRRNINWKIIKKLVIMLGVALILFYGIGKTKQYKSSFLDSLSIYGGSGLYNLNLYIHEHPSGKLNPGDSGTFVSIQNMLARLGFMSKSAFERIDEFISYQTTKGYFYRSNVYTAIKTYYYDYGIWGVIILPLISGIFFQWFYRQINQKKLGFSCILYASFIYPVVYYPILEQMFNKIHFGTMYELFWLILIFYIIYGKSGLWRIRMKRNLALHITRKSLRIFHKQSNYKQGNFLT